MADEKELKDQRVPIMMTPSELEAIDDWMFKNRIRSRGEAIRRLCQIGLGFDGRVELLQSAIDKHTEALSEAMMTVLSKGRGMFGRPAGNDVADKFERLLDTLRELDDVFLLAKAPADAFRLSPNMKVAFAETADTTAMIEEFIRAFRDPPKE